MSDIINVSFSVSPSNIAEIYLVSHLLSFTLLNSNTGSDHISAISLIMYKIPTHHNFVFQNFMLFLIKNDPHINTLVVGLYNRKQRLSIELFKNKLQTFPCSLSETCYSIYLF